jgi:hypothetical protein
MFPAVAVLADGRVLVAGGNSSAVAEKPLASAEIFDPKTGTFSATGSMNTPRDGLDATRLLDGRVLISGGATDASAELFVPGPGTFTLTGTMTTFRAGQTTATLLKDGRVFIEGGGAGQDAHSAEIYQP